MHYRIRYMYVKYQLNRDNRFVKTVITKKNLNCINLQLAIRIKKNLSFQICITRPPIFRPNLRPIGMLQWWQKESGPSAILLKKEQTRVKHELTAKQITKNS